MHADVFVLLRCLARAACCPLQSLLLATNHLEALLAQAEWRRVSGFAGLGITMLPA